MLMNGKELLTLKDCSAGLYIISWLPSLSLMHTQTGVFTFAHFFLRVQLGEDLDAPKQ